MFFSGGLIPTYLLIRSLGLLNTFWVMVLPTAVAAYTTFVFRAFFMNIPAELRESAFMDGANDIRILFSIYLPLSKPLLATFGLFTAVSHWNRWFEALIYLRSPERFPLQMILRRYIIAGSVSEGFEQSAAQTMIMQGLIHPENLKMAVIVVTMVPILCVYPFIQKYFAKGVMIGAIKG
jgi:putative aldouronate transport system permease protein